MTGARIFVAVIFGLLGLAFVASTLVLLAEFEGPLGISMMMVHSHLFFFFPTFGLLALAAFYLPAVVFTHFYWFRVPAGRVRFVLGFAVVIAASIYFAGRLAGTEPRGLWEISPAAHETAFRSTPICPNCREAPALARMLELRDEARDRVGFGKFSRQCKDDTLLEPPKEFAERRRCFAAPASPLLTRDDCCTAQTRFTKAVTSVWREPDNLSRSARLDRFMLPIKCFFVGVVLAIGFLLAVWRAHLDRHYGPDVPAIERGILIGAIAMLTWPLLDYGYLETTNMLFGRLSDGPEWRMSLVVAPWALLLLFYFMQRLGRDLERVAQIAGIVGSGVAVLRYDDINDWALRLAGAGAHMVPIAGMLVLLVAGFVALYWPRKRELAPAASPQA